jgi:hypothetical protein
MFATSWAKTGKRSGRVLRHEVEMTTKSSAIYTQGAWVFQMSLEVEQADGAKMWLDLDGTEAMKLLRALEDFQQFCRERAAR